MYFTVAKPIILKYFQNNVTKQHLASASNLPLSQPQHQFRLPSRPLESNRIEHRPNPQRCNGLQHNERGCVTLGNEMVTFMLHFTHLLHPLFWLLRCLHAAFHTQAPFPTRVTRAVSPLPRRDGLRRISPHEQIASQPIIEIVVRHALNFKKEW